MGGFCYISKHGRSPDQLATTREATRQQFTASGFGRPVAYDDADGVLDFYPKIKYPCSNSILLPDGFAIVVGTFLYGNAVGAEALRRFTRANDPDAALSDAGGHFVLLLRRGAKTLLLRDRVGAFEVYSDDTLGVISSSFLAVARSLRRVQPNRQEIYEYVFNGVSLGDTTPVVGIQRLGFGERIVIDPMPMVIRTERPLCPALRTDSVEMVAHDVLGGLLDYTAMLGRVFNGRIKLALTGGYDSRLLLGLFRRNGVLPELFVYGPAGSQDVLVARQIAASEGLAIRHIDATTLPRVMPDEIPGHVAAKFHREDGLTSSGIFASDVDLVQRADRHAPDYLHVNGGGGEVLRNFFNLFDRGVSLRQFVWLFYSQYDPAICDQDFKPASYEDAICVKISSLLGTDEPRLDRSAVECLYPYFRCRSWYGRENSVNNRFGYSVMPYFDRRIVDMALSVPISYKHFGNFEAQMIRAADQTLAAYPSNYGHNFLADAPAWKRLAALANYARPLTLRRLTFRLKSRLCAAEPMSALLAPESIGRVVASNLPRMARYFRIPHVRSSLQFNRIATLEYLFDQLHAA